VGASVHHHHAVPRAKKELGVADDADAIVRNAVKEQDPVAIGVRRADLPATEQSSVGGTYLKVFAAGVDAGKGGVAMFNVRWQKGLAHGVKDAAAEQPAGAGREARENENPCESEFCGAAHSRKGYGVHGREVARHGSQEPVEE
jgi:hypothetical protein